MLALPDTACPAALVGHVPARSVPWSVMHRVGTWASRRRPGAYAPGGCRTRALQASGRSGACRGPSCTGWVRGRRRGGGPERMHRVGVGRRHSRDCRAALDRRSTRAGRAATIRTCRCGAVRIAGRSRKRQPGAGSAFVRRPLVRPAVISGDRSQATSATAASILGAHRLMASKSARAGRAVPIWRCASRSWLHGWVLGSARTPATRPRCGTSSRSPRLLRSPPNAGDLRRRRRIPPRAPSSRRRLKRAGASGATRRVSDARRPPRAGSCAGTR